MTCASAILASCALAGSPGAFREAYRPTTLARALERCQARAAGRDAVFAREAYLVHAIHGGGKRPVPAERRSFLERWTRSVGVRRGVASLYAEEILFREGTRELWLPVQAQLVPRIEKELGPGGAGDLRVLWAGAWRGDCVFLVNEVEAATGPRP
jgi:hypothetical protein